MPVRTRLQQKKFLKKVALKEEEEGTPYQYLTALQPEHCLEVGLAQTAQVSGTPLEVAPIVTEEEEREEDDEWKLASTTKYLEAAVRRM